MEYETIKSAVVLLSMAAAMLVFGIRAYKLLWGNLKLGSADEPFVNWGRRLGGALQYVAGQRRLFRVLVPGTAHFFIFWGFLILSLTILHAIVEGLLAFKEPHLVIPVLGDFGPLALLQDLFATFVVVAVGYALYVRLAVDPVRYRGSHKGEGVRVLIYILTIMLSLLLMNGIRRNLGLDPISDWRPISSVVSRLVRGFAPEQQQVIGEAAYWVHLGVVLFFLTELPGGKHFHVVTSLPAVTLRNLEPPGRLKPAPEFNGDVGVSVVERFSRRTMLGFYTCSECGRCQDVCPAFASGLDLSPKLLIMSLRDNLIERGEALRALSSGGAVSPSLEQELTGEVISEDALWACTTCYACDQECPLFVEHVAPIVDMRRHLVIEGRVDETLQSALDNLGRYGNSFGQSERARAKWTRGLEFEIKDARVEPVEYLWFLGDYASYSASLTDITIKTAQVFQKAGLDFGILFDGERNAGNDVRRIGEEGLFEMLVEQNLEALDGSLHKAIVTTDPHSYNTLKNEYARNGADVGEVLHYSELIARLLAEGRISFSRELGYRVTYHDACYLGRYNGIYDAPREVIKAAGCELVEMPRNHDRALCCGAGGGRIWMDEGPVKERPSEARIGEAMGIEGLSQFIVACPKDVTMYLDALKTTGLEDRLAVRDLIEVVHEALEPAS